jgi:hypothetical protein
MVTIVTNGKFTFGFSSTRILLAAVQPSTASAEKTIRMKTGRRIAILVSHIIASPPARV